MQHMTRYNAKYTYNSVRPTAWRPGSRLHAPRLPTPAPRHPLLMRFACAPSRRILSAHPRRCTCLGPWQIQALGFVSVFDQIFDGYKWGDADAIFK